MTTPEWRKPSHCDTGACAEVRTWPSGHRTIRNSTTPIEVVTFTADEWAAFITAAKAGEFDGD